MLPHEGKSAQPWGAGKLPAQTQHAVSEPYLTGQETMARLKISRETLRKLIRKGELQAFKIGDGKTSDLRVTEASILAFVKRHTVPVPRATS